MKRRILVPDWAVRFADDFTGIDRFDRPINPEEEPTVTVDLPDDAYYEYGFFDADGKLRGDPEADEDAKNPWYPGLSVIRGPQWEPGEFSEIDPSAASGTVDRERIVSHNFEKERRLIVYTPEGYETAALPTVYVQDGVAFFRIGKLHAIYAALLREKRVQPARLVFIEPFDRADEYGYSDDYVDFVTEELPRWVFNEFDAHPDAYYVGASLGGLASMLSAIENPANAKGLATFSGAFLGTPAHKEFYKTDDSWLLNNMQDVVQRVPKWFLHTGKLEWLYEVNKEIATGLDKAGAAHRYVESSAGHNWGNWLHVLAPALEYLLSDE